MNCIQKIKQTCQDRFTSQLKTHTNIALWKTSYILLGCHACMAVSIKALSCCIKYKPQYVLFFSPVHIWLSVVIMRHGYREVKGVLLDWKREEAQKIRSQKLRDASKKTASEDDEPSEETESSNCGKSKRRNHRGGAKVKKSKAEEKMRKPPTYSEGVYLEEGLSGETCRRS